MLVVEKEKVIMEYFKYDGAEIEVVSAMNRYGTLPIRFYDDLNLSPKAWGILGKIFLLKSRNENWKISVNGLVTQIKGGRDLVLSTVKELKENGYLHIMQGRNENGSFGITKWYIFESPEDNPFFLKADDMPESENPSTVENTAVGKSEYGQKTPQSENPHTGKSATAVGKPEYGQKPLNSPQSENPHTENPTQTKIERKIERYKKENLSKEKENSSLFKKIRELEMEIGGITQDFYYKLTRAYVSIKNIVQAVGMLKYDKENGYGIENLTAKQERLIDGVSEYGSALAKDNEYPELAKQMDNKVGIDESIESFVKLPEPERTRESRSSRDWDIEL